MRDGVYVRYVAASAAALGIDFGSFLVALSLGTPPAMAAALGYTIGIAVHWLLSSRVVFLGRLAAVGASRRQQQALFVVTGLIGLGLTTGIVGVGTWYGFDPRLAKGMAIVVSFQTAYLLRRKIVFA